MGSGTISILKYSLAMLSLEKYGAMVQNYQMARTLFSQGRPLIAFDPKPYTLRCHSVMYPQNLLRRMNALKP